MRRFTLLMCALFVSAFVFAQERPADQSEYEKFQEEQALEQQMAERFSDYRDKEFPAGKDAVVDYSKGLSYRGDIEVLILSPDDDGTEAIRAALDGFDEITATSFTQGDLPNITLSDLTPYDVILTFNNNQWMDVGDVSEDLIGDLLADYIDQGGLFIENSYVMDWDAWQMGGDYVAEGYSAFEQATADHSGIFNMGTVHEPDHPIMTDVDTFGTDGSSLIQDNDVAEDATRIVDWDNGEVLVAVKDQVVSLNFLTMASGALNYVGDGTTLYKNAVVWLVMNQADPDAPAEPENFEAVAGDDGALHADLSWDNPDETVDGETLTELTAINVYRNGDLIHTVSNPTIGGSETYHDDDITEDGAYSYEIRGENNAGEGLPASYAVYIGEDVPAAPENVQLTADGNDGLITWDAPTEGYSGGYFSGDNLTYTVVRYPGEVEVASEITEETYTDDDVPGVGNFYYEIIAINHIGEGGTAESNVALLGADDILLLETFEEDLFPPVGWEYVNGVDGSYWQQSSVASHTGDYAARSYQGVSSGYEADEWLMTPAIDMDDPDAQMITFYGYSSQAPDGTRENMRIMAVDQYYDNVDDLHDNATLLQVVPFEGEWTEHIVDISQLEGEQHLIFNYYITDEDNASFNWIYVDHVMVGDFDTFTFTMMDPDGEGDVTPEVGDHLYLENTEVEIEADPAYTWSFEKWEVDGEFYSDEPVTTITIQDDVDVQAFFIAEESFTLTMEDPEGDGTVDPEPGDHSYLGDDEVTLTATADIGWVFSHWTGDVEDTNSNQTTIIMDDDHTVKAHFDVFDGLDLPWNETFAGVPAGEIPTNWARTHPNWAVNNSDNAGGEAPEIRFNWSPASEDEFRLTSPKVLTSGYDALLLTFDHYVNNFSSPGIYTLRVIAIADGDEHIIHEWVDPDNIGPEEVELILTEDQHGVGTDDFHIVWEFDGDSYDINQWYFDNVHLGEAPDLYEVTFYVMEDSADEDPIEGASINIDGDIYHTDENGVASAMLADDMTYTADITASGYVAEEVTFTVDGQDKDIDVHMMDDIQDPFNLEIVTEGQEPGDALFIWNDYGDEYEFRYDDGVADAQLGFQGTWNSVMGAAHHNDAVLFETTWYLTEEGGPHNTVKVWVLGLDANGMPDRNDVIYTAENVPNNDNEWNTYEFTEPVEAPNGFFVGLSYDGFLGLAVDDGVGEPWDFVPGTQFGVFDITDPTSAFTDISDWDFAVNFLLRAYGANQGDIDFGKQELPMAAGPAPELIPMDKPVDAGNPFNPAGQKAFLGFNVFLNDDMVAEEIEENEYLFTDLPEGDHTAGVQSVYTTGSSEIETIDFTITHDVDPDMYTVTFDVMDEDGNALEDAIVTFDGVSYDAGHYVIEDVEEGTYDYMVEKAGYYTAEGDVFVDDDITVEVVLVEEEVETFAVTFHVDLDLALEHGVLEGFDPEMHHILMTGEMFGWTEPDPAHEDMVLDWIDDDPMTYAITLHLEAGTYEYKYFSDLIGDGWEGGEWEGGDNRMVEVTGEMEVTDHFGFTDDEVSVIDTEPVSLNIYPNPARSTLYIEADATITQVRMIDMLGQVVYNTSAGYQRHEINVGNFDTGVYFIQVTTGKGVETTRVQITR